MTHTPKAGNPLRVDGRPGSDTRNFVRAVLTFMSDAFASLEESRADVKKESLTGAALIMDVCVDALEEVEE